MAYEMKDNTGSLFANDKKTKDTQPSHKGQGLIGGTEYWISAWVKESKDGKRYFSFSFEPKDEQAKRAAKDAQSPDSRYEQREPEDDSDSIPF